MSERRRASCRLCGQAIEYLRSRYAWRHVKRAAWDHAPIPSDGSLELWP